MSAWAMSYQFGDGLPTSLIYFGLLSVGLSAWVFELKVVVGFAKFLLMKMWKRLRVVVERKGNGTWEVGGCLFVVCRQRQTDRNSPRQELSHRKAANSLLCETKGSGWARASRCRLAQAALQQFSLIKENRHH
jgi:hypothetical protein